MEKIVKKSANKKQFLFEVAWETCNQVGGIYTVIRTKVPSMVEKWGDDYTLLGPYFTHTAAAEFEPLELSEEDSPINNSIRTLRSLGLKVHYGHWLITGKPKIILFAASNKKSRVEQWKNECKSLGINSYSIYENGAYVYEIE